MFRRIFLYCGILEIVVGMLLFVIMTASFVDPGSVITNIFQIPPKHFGRYGLSENSWAQAAVAFGMHAYADLANGIEIVLLSRSKPKNIPLTITVWNTCRFIISFLWLLVLIQGMIRVHGVNNVATWPQGGLILIGLLAFDACLLRPVAVYCQRKINDENPPIAFSEANEFKHFSYVQKFCRGVFYYEAILSGCSGMVYFVFPELFVWLYFPNVKADFVSLWSLAQFGVNVMAFGLYQMSADIDTRTGHVVWWLILDVVWMYFYWKGVTSVLGDWNPLLLSGANIWCHFAFHADSTLAIARSIFLYTLATKGRGKLKVR